MTITGLKRFYGAVTPAALESELRAQGYGLDATTETVRIWMKAGPDTLSAIWVPVHQDFADYEARVLDALNDLAVHGLRPSATLHRLLPEDLRPELVAHFFPDLASATGRDTQ